MYSFGENEFQKQPNFGGFLIFKGWGVGGFIFSCVVLTHYHVFIIKTLQSYQLSRIGCDARMSILMDSSGVVAYVVRGTLCRLHLWRGDV